MSHSVTITRTTTTATGHSLFINSGYISSLPGLLKLAELLLSAAIVGVIGYYFSPYYNYYSIPWQAELFLLLVSTSFLIGTFCLLTSRMVSLTTSLSDNVHEVIYHGLAFVLYLAAGLTLIIELNHNKSSGKQYEALTAAAVMGLVCAGLYLISTFLANRAYRGI